jgi:uncharacterized protein YjdB
VATVDANGKVTPIKMGTTTITAKTTDGNFEASCEVTVEPINAETPEITAHPQGTMVSVGKTHSLHVTASATDGGTLSYQWYAGETAITGATSSSYSVPTATEAITQYKVVVTNRIDENGDGGTNKTASATSDVATVTVNNLVHAQDPAIIANPQSASYRQGATATALAVEATSPDEGGIISYQWHSNTAETSSGGTPIAGATEASYAPPTTTLGTLYYYAAITNTIPDNEDGGTKTAAIASSAAAITIEATPATGITLSQTAATLNIGGSFSLTATVLPANANDKSVTWSSSDPSVADYDDGTVTAFSLGTATITAITADGGHTATCEVEVNDLVNAQMPNITAQPLSATYVQGATATALTVEASPDEGGTLSYQWYGNEELIASATAANYTPSTENIGSFCYYVMVTNTNNSVTGTKIATVKSAEATITVSEPEPSSSSAYSSSSSSSEDSSSSIEPEPALSSSSSDSIATSSSSSSSRGANNPVIVSRITSGQITAQATSNAIILENLPQNAKVQIYNLQGRRIYSNNNHENPKILQIMVQTKGLYFIKINSSIMRIVVK